MIRLALCVLSFTLCLPEMAIAAKGGRWAADGNAPPGKEKKSRTVEADSVAPQINVPDLIVAEATSAGGAIVTYSVHAKDGVDGPVSVSCIPASGALFPIKTTLVSCSSSDAAGNVASASFSVKVTDSAAPQLTLPSGIISESADGSKVALNYSANAFDTVDGNLPLNCAPASGSLFDIGETTVACESADSAGNTSHGTFVVIVNDTSPEPEPEPEPATLFSVNVGWQIPTVRADGTPLTLAELAEYAIVYDSDASLSNLKTLNVPSFDANGQPISDFEIPNLPAGTYYFAIAAVDTQGMASNFSDLVVVDLK